MTRTRSRVVDQHTQHVYRKVTGVVVTDHDEVVQTLSVCKDDVQQGGGYPFVDNHPLLIDHYDRSSMIANGESNPGGSSNTKITSWIPDYIATAPLNHGNPAGVPSALDDALKVLARTNPNRTNIDIGEDLIQGLPGLPLSIKRAGDSIIDNAARDHLWWSFGFKPLIEDILDLLKYQEMFEQRLREFNSLFDKGGLRRRVQLGTYSSFSNLGSTVLQSNYFSIIATRLAHTSINRWGTVRWYPYGWQLLDIPETELRARIRRLLLGLDASPSSIWRKLPWTWLAGWFSTVGLWLQANKNNFAVLPGPVCIMDHTQTQYTFSLTSKSDWISLSGRTASHESKQRTVVLPGSLPISFFRPSHDWDLGKSSILGSLAITRLGQGKW